MINNSGGGSIGGGGARMGGGAATMTGARGSASFGGVESRGGATSSMISMKQNSNVARSESLAFKSKVARPIINMEQKAVKFSAERKSQNNRLERGVRQNEISRINKPESQSHIRHAQIKDARLAYTRQELRNIVTTPRSEVYAAMEKQIQKVRMLDIPKNRSENSRAKVLESYQKMIGKPQIEQKPITKAEPAVKKLQKIDVKAAVKQRVGEIMKKMSARVELQRIKKSQTKNEVKLAPLSTEKYQKVVEEKVQAQIATKVKINEQVSTAVKPATRSENAVKNSTQPETKTTTKAQSETQTFTKTIDKLATEAIQQADTVVGVKPEIDDQGKKEVKDEKNKPEKPKFAYFIVDDETNQKRKDTIEKTYLKLKDKLTRAGINRKPTGVEVAASAYKDILDTKSKSILNSQDGSAVMFIGHVAKAEEIVSLDSLQNIGTEAVIKDPAADLTLKPEQSKIIGAKEAYVVHGKTIFPARMDGSPVIVKLENNLVEA